MTRSERADEILQPASHAAFGRATTIATPTSTQVMAKRERDGDVSMDDGATDEAAVIEAFLTAVKAGDIDSVRSALSEDKDLVDLEDAGTCYTPLHHAVGNGHLSVVRELLKHGASPADVAADGSTSLHIAASRAGHNVASDIVVQMERIVTLLIDRGCPLPAVDKEGNTALHCAALHGSIGILRTLLLLMGDDGRRNAAGQSLMDCAVQCSHPPVVELLKKHTEGSSTSVG